MQIKIVRRSARSCVTLGGKSQRAPSKGHSSRCSTQAATCSKNLGNPGDRSLRTHGTKGEGHALSLSKDRTAKRTRKKRKEPLAPPEQRQSQRRSRGAIPPKSRQIPREKKARETLDEEKTYSEYRKSLMQKGYQHVQRYRKVPEKKMVDKTGGKLAQETSERDRVGKNKLTATRNALGRPTL